MFQIDLSDYAYTPMFLVFFHLLTGVSRKLCHAYFTQSSPTVVSQNIISTINALTIVILKSAYQWLGQSYYQTLMRQGLVVCMSYFLYDTVLICLYEWSQYPFIIHHTIALIIAYGIRDGVFGELISTNYISYIELSNLFLGVWDICRRSKAEPVPGLLYDLITPLNALTYIPIRTVGLSILTYQMIASLRTHVLFYKTLLILILLMSYFFSYKLSNIYRYRLGTYTIGSNPAFDKYAQFFKHRGVVTWVVVSTFASQITLWHIVPNIQAPLYIKTTLAISALSSLYAYIGSYIKHIITSARTLDKEA